MRGSSARFGYFEVNTCGTNFQFVVSMLVTVSETLVTLTHLQRCRTIAEPKGLVILDVVACRDGRVTNIAVVQKQPYGLTDTAIKAARKVKFRPAEKDGQLVSQRSVLNISLECSRQFVDVRPQ